MKNNDTLTALQPGDSLEAFRGLCSRCAETMTEAASMLGRLCAADKSTIEKLSSGKHPIPESFLNALMRVAEHSLHPALLLNRCPAYRRLALLPYSAQKEVIERGKIELVIGPDEGDVLLVDAWLLEGEQLKQAFGAAGVRSCDEQRSYMRRTRILPVEKIVGPPYAIKRDKLTVLRACEFSKGDILRVLEQMVA